jgi:hypothetical protein
MFKLQQISGLTNLDPLHLYLGVVDSFLGEYDWNCLSSTSDELLEFLFPEHGNFSLRQGFQEYLEKNDPLFAEIINKLKQKKDKEGINDRAITLVIVYIIANLDYFKELSCTKYRSIDAAWKPSKR